MKLPSLHYPVIEQEARQAFVTSPPTHDFSHTERVVRLCLRIGREEGADLEILYAAALLHDIARDDGDAKGECHARLSAEKARPILEKAGFPREKQEAVVHCIETHRFRSDAPPQSLEAKILYDSDKLDAIGAIGVCRAYAYCGENGQRLYENFPNSSSESCENGGIPKVTDHKNHTPVREFCLKLSKIRDKLFTPSARRLAETRHEFMLHFFHRLKEEVEGEQ